MPHAEARRDTFAHLRRTVTRVEHVVQLAERAMAIPSPNQSQQPAARLVALETNKPHLAGGCVKTN